MGYNTVIETPSSWNYFGQRLRALRLWNKISCNQLDVMAGLSKGTTSRLERGMKFPTLTTARSLASALNQQSLSCWD